MVVFRPTTDSTSQNPAAGVCKEGNSSRISLRKFSGYPTEDPVRFLVTLMPIVSFPGSMTQMGVLNWINYFQCTIVNQVIGIFMLIGCVHASHAKGQDT